MSWDEDYYINCYGEKIHVNELSNIELKNMSMADYATYVRLKGLDRKPKSETYVYSPAVKEIWSQSIFPEVRELSRHSNQVDLDTVVKSQALYVEDLKMSNTQLAKKLKETREEVTALKEQLAEKSRVPAPVKEEPKPVEGSYSYWYWQFVKRTDPVEAAEAFSNMLEKVTPDYQPVSEWHSRFPRTRIFIIRRQFLVKNIISALFVALTIAGILIGTS